MSSPAPTSRSRPIRKAGAPRPRRSAITSWAVAAKLWKSPSLPRAWPNARPVAAAGKGWRNSAGRTQSSIFATTPAWSRP
ncbi:hypothetical protein X768_29600 [Mesorhizobium sp. LSJC265A00]|nr:hypothetical protein X768_29600 [Mesorhizobium sp. LSJC265A00]ESZ65817.1 hypothetical protein X729_02720 [Mesorhizobium sp. L103C131B0]